MNYLSVCSGIEAATAAWHPLGWKPVAFSEIEDAPRRVLAHHYPTVPCHGDFTTIGENDYGAVDLLVGGTPCQDFSIAGLRKGLAGERGNLTLEFVRLAQRKRPRWVLWENVTGVLSQDGGRAFGALLGGLAELGYGFAYRVLDSQHFGVAQQRRRVFVVGHLGNWRAAAAVLFERESLLGYLAPSDEEGQAIADDAVEAFTAEGGRAISFTKSCIGKTINNQTPLIAYGIKAGNMTSNGWGIAEERSHAFNTGDRHAVAYADVLRRFTPLEVERLFGFPDYYTAVDGLPDGKRYEMLGNSMAVPCMGWLGKRIEMVEGLLRG